MRRDDVLRCQRDFDRVYRAGKSVGDRYVVVFFHKNGKNYSRKAFLASKKVGNSVERNRARRLMKEAVRNGNIELPAGYDFVFIARNTINTAKCGQVQRSISHALRRTGVMG